MTSIPQSLRLLGDVSVDVSVELGRTKLPLKHVMALGEESVVTLDRLTDELLDVLVNGKPIAKAEVVTVENKFGLRIVELVGQDEAVSVNAPRPNEPASSPLAAEGTATPQQQDQQPSAAPVLSEGTDV
jgi:flagellar motor switch protein FliN/FliY